MLSNGCYNAVWFNILHPVNNPPSLWHSSIRNKGLVPCIKLIFNKTSRTGQVSKKWLTKVSFMYNILHWIWKKCLALPNTSCHISLSWFLLLSSAPLVVFSQYGTFLKRHGRDINPGISSFYHFFVFNPLSYHLRNQNYNLMPRGLNFKVF